jgi:hypothetical protein
MENTNKDSERQKANRTQQDKKGGTGQQQVVFEDKSWKRVTKKATVAVNKKDNEATTVATVSKRCEFLSY